MPLSGSCCPTAPTVDAYVARVGVGTRLEVRRVAGALGAEVLGVDLRHLDDETIAAIHDAFLEHLVLFFRGQDLTPAELVAFAERIGEPVEYPFVTGIPGHPTVIEVAKLEHERVNFGGVWHADTTYLERPPKASMLLAREVPPYGGDTLFANMHLAYDALSPGLRLALDGVHAVNSSAKADVSQTREDRVREAGRGEDTHAVYEAIHPAVRTHPETGRKALYVNPAHTVRFDGWTEEESEPLLSFLHHSAVRPEHTCRFSWAVGSLAMWDNRSTQHNPVNDYHGHRRRMHRVTLAGDVPR